MCLWSVNQCKSGFPSRDALITRALEGVLITLRKAHQKGYWVESKTKNGFYLFGKERREEKAYSFFGSKGMAWKGHLNADHKERRIGPFRMII